MDCSRTNKNNSYSHLRSLSDNPQLFKQKGDTVVINCRDSSVFIRNRRSFKLRRQCKIKAGMCRIGGFLILLPSGGRMKTVFGESNTKFPGGILDFSWSKNTNKPCRLSLKLTLNTKTAKITSSVSSVK